MKNLLMALLLALPFSAQALDVPDLLEASNVEIFETFPCSNSAGTDSLGIEKWSYPMICLMFTLDEEIHQAITDPNDRSGEILYVIKLNEEGQVMLVDDLDTLLPTPAAPDTI